MSMLDVLNWMNAMMIALPLFERVSGSNEGSDQVNDIPIGQLKK